MTRLVDELFAAMEAGRARPYRRALARLAKSARTAGPADLTAAVEALAPRLPGLGGDFAEVAVLAAALVEQGASPLALAGVLPHRVAEAMMLNEALPDLWAGAGNEGPPPEPVAASAPELIAGLMPLAGPPRSVDVAALRRIAMSWSDMDDWLKAFLSLMTDPSFRAAVPAEVKRDVRESAALLAVRSQPAAWAGQLAAVLDGEPLIVLDPGARRGYALTMSGIGDNLQLHTLLADRLIGDPADGLVAGERPDPSWVAAATTGNPHLGTDNPAVRRFRLFDGHGGYVSPPDAVPADIRPLDGTRVLVLHPPNGSYGMGVGRVFEHMAPTLTLDRHLTPEETASWLARISPAVENDLMAR